MDNVVVSEANSVNSLPGVANLLGESLQIYKSSDTLYGVKLSK